MLATMERNYPQARPMHGIPRSMYTRENGREHKNHSIMATSKLGGSEFHEATYEDSSGSVFYKCRRQGLEEGYLLIPLGHPSAPRELNPLNCCLAAQLGPNSLNPRILRTTKHDLEVKGSDERAKDWKA